MFDEGNRFVLPLVKHEVEGVESIFCFLCHEGKELFAVESLTVDSGIVAFNIKQRHDNIGDGAFVSDGGMGHFSFFLEG
jgi:hypothetical protein